MVIVASQCKVAFNAQAFKLQSSRKLSEVSWRGWLASLGEFRCENPREDSQPFKKVYP
jgi:hypothetical protein